MQQLTNLALLALSLPSAQAALILFEGFDYAGPPASLTQGEVVTGAEGGSGFSGAWEQAVTTNNNSTAPMTFLTEGLSTLNPLAHPGVGGAARDGDSAIRGVERSFPAVDISGNGELWFSFLVRQEASGLTHFSLGDGTVSNNSGHGSGLRVSMNSGTGSLQAGLGTVSGAAETGFSLATTHWVVGRFTYSDSTDDRLDLWRNPESVELGLPVSSVTVANATFTVNTLILHSLATAQTTFDEIRLGTAAADVMIPEPSAFALFSLFLGFLVLRHRSARA